MSQRCLGSAGGSGVIDTPISFNVIALLRYGSHTIHPFQVYNSIACDTFTGWCRPSSRPPRETHTLQLSLSIPPTPAPGSHKPTFGLHTFMPFLDISQTQNHTVCGLLGLSSFIQHEVFDVSWCQRWIPFQGGVIFHGAEGLHFIYPFFW